MCTQYSEVTFQCIAAKSNHEWANLYWREETGRVIINSSYGDWSFSWRHRGDQSLAAFLYKLDMDYMGGKMLGINYYVFSRTKTVECIREHILEERRRAGLTKDEARTAWDNFVQLEDGDISFETWATNEDVLGDTFDFHCTEPEPSWFHFWNKLWLPCIVPELKKLTCKEVKHEPL